MLKNWTEEWREKKEEKKKNKKIKGTLMSGKRRGTRVKTVILGKISWSRIKKIMTMKWNHKASYFRN